VLGLAVVSFGNASASGLSSEILSLLVGRYGGIVVRIDVDDFARNVDLCRLYGYSFCSLVDLCLFENRNRRFCGVVKLPALWSKWKLEPKMGLCSMKLHLYLALCVHHSVCRRRFASSCLKLCYAVMAERLGKSRAAFNLHVLEELHLATVAYFQQYNNEEEDIVLNRLAARQPSYTKVPGALQPAWRHTISHNKSIHLLRRSQTGPSATR